MNSLSDLPAAAALRRPDATAFVAEDPSGSVAVTWDELARRVASMRGGLRARRVGRGDRVALSMRGGPDLVAALLAVVAEGCVAVVLPTPRGRRDGAYADRLAGVWADCAPALLIETPAEARRRAAIEGLTAVTSADAAELAAADPVHEPGAPGDDETPVILQYTSGSTKRPRGVVLTTGMLEANCRQARAAYGDHEDDVAVSWVPLYHDMGLVTAVVRPLFSGYTSVLLQPADFIAEPIRWLRAVHEHRATLSSAPDFAYAHCVRRIPQADLEGLDLSCWRIARSAGEVVRPETMDAFTAFAAPAGFRAEAFCPSYGMAEATLTVTASTPRARPRRVRMNPASLAPGAIATPDPDGRELLSSGPPVPDTTVDVVGAAGKEGLVGELEIRGPQVMSGYFHAPAPHTPDGALRTGDLGFVLDGEVFVLGRADDAMVLNGANLFQHDLVAACGSVPGIRPGRAAAFVDDRIPDRQEVVVVAETTPGFAQDADDAGRAALVAAVRARVLDRLGVIVAHVQTVEADALPVTTSGKVQVAAIRAAWLERRSN
ncbi:AMP-binding protein [Actinospica durhamensis]|uniref:AMP-binding protein n=1 Tax=Actinospica durhamensis TaxID=1508375 RepID=A0A941EW48_9ACTN|nr:AMP-binding protein [Actinospica durhamensis]MBR7836094.1 AMP-binding protein [Actinospica durhamensis]